MVIISGFSLRRLFGFTHQLDRHLAGALLLGAPADFSQITIQEVAMKITISIGEQRLTIVAQGDEYEIVLPDRIERKDTTAAPLKREEPKVAPATVAPVAAESNDFLVRYSDDQLRCFGLDRGFLHRVWQLVQRKGTVTSSEIARELKLPKRSQRLGYAISILLNERLIHQVGDHKYSKRPEHYKPADDLTIMKVLDAIIAKPGMTNTEIATMVGIVSPTVSKITRYLTAQGLIRREPVMVRRGTGNVPFNAWLNYPAE